MAITTLEQVKLLNNITVTTYDNIINANIPLIEDSIHTFTNNNFISSNIVKHNKACEREFKSSNPNKGYITLNETNVYAYGEYVVDTALKTITAVNDDFADFASGDSIAIDQSNRVNGFYTIDTVTDTVITVLEDIKTEDSIFYIILLDYPKALSGIAANMVAYDSVKRSKKAGVKSENIGSYSYTLQDVNGMGYPSDIVGNLASYKMHRVL